jgi:hypothetical protein
LPWDNAGPGKANIRVSDPFDGLYLPATMATLHMGPAEVDTVQSGAQGRAAGSDGDVARLLVYRPRTGPLCTAGALRRFSAGSLNRRAKQQTARLANPGNPSESSLATSRPPPAHRLVCRLSAFNRVSFRCSPSLATLGPFRGCRQLSLGKTETK